MMPEELVPGTTTGSIGVSGIPLASLIFTCIVHSLYAAPRQPLSSVRPPIPMPVVYVSDAFSTFRWSNVDSPRCAAGLVQSCATCELPPEVVTDPCPPRSEEHT